MKKSVTALFILLLPALLAAEENYPYFLDAQSIRGYTGAILVPSARALSHKAWSFGLHRFIIGVTHGLLPFFEAGINLDLKEMSPLFPLDQENIKRKGEELSVHSKYHLLREEEHPFDLAVGQRRSMIYLAAGKYLPSVAGLTLQGGLAWERTLTTFFSVNQTNASRQVMLDYEPASNRYSIGLRFLVSPEMKLDFFIIDATRITNLFFDNFMFGLTVAG